MSKYEVDVFIIRLTINRHQKIFLALTLKMTVKAKVKIKTTFILIFKQLYVMTSVMLAGIAFLQFFFR